MGFWNGDSHTSTELLLLRGSIHCGVRAGMLPLVPLMAESPRMSEGRAMVVPSKKGAAVKRKGQEQPADKSLHSVKDGVPAAQDDLDDTAGSGHIKRST